MAMTVIKNKAEEAIAATIANRTPKLPGGANVRKMREDAAAVFNASGLPHRRIEEWKYTDLRTLLKDQAASEPTSADAAQKLVQRALPGVTAQTYIFVDGKLTSQPHDDVPKGVSVVSLAESLLESTASLRSDLPDTVDLGAASVIALNTALAAGGASITIAAKTKLKEPIHLIFISSGVTAVRTKIVLGADSSATIIETHTGAGGRQEFAVTDVELGERAALHHVVNSATAAGDAFIAQTIARVERQAAYAPFQFHRGLGVTRQQLTLTFAGEHATLDFSSAALVRANGHSDTTLIIDHAVPHCTSRELYKTVLDDSARGIFQGKVIVRPDAQKTDGKQMAQALMLSPDAEFDSKPELEIYADDVICGHGTTSAEIDEDMLFYCKSRGIPETEARALLIESFIGEVIDKVENESIRESLMGLARAWLATPHV